MNHRFEFQQSARIQREAMTTAAGALMTKRDKFIFGAMGLVLAVLCALGGLSIAAWLAHILNQSPSWWIVGGWIAGGAIFLTHQNVLVRVLAARASKKPFNQGTQVITLDDTGLTLSQQGLNWQSPWAFVDKAIVTKNTLSVSVGGITFAIPKDAIGTPDTVQALHAEITDRLPNG